MNHEANKTEEKEFLFSIGDIIYDKSNNDRLMVLSYVSLNDYRHYISFDLKWHETTENTIGYIEHFYKKV